MIRLNYICSPSLDIITSKKLLVHVLLLLWGVGGSPPTLTPPVLMGNVRHVLSVETAYCTWGYSGCESHWF